MLENLVYECYSYSIYTKEIADVIADNLEDMLNINLDNTLEDICYDLYVKVFGDEA